MNLSERVDATQKDIFTLEQKKNEQATINNEIDEIHTSENHASYEDGKMDAFLQEILELKEKLKQWTYSISKSNSTRFLSHTTCQNLNEPP